MQHSNADNDPYYIILGDHTHTSNVFSSVESAVVNYRISSLEQECVTGNSYAG